jgi:hypothetical protein
MDMLFDQVVDIEGHDMPIALPFSKVRRRRAAAFATSRHIKD